MSPTQNNDPQWYFQNDGEVIGPMSHQELVKLVQASRIKPDSLIRSEDQQSWSKAKTVAGLFAVDPQDTNAENSAKAAANLLSNLHHRGLHASEDEEETESIWSRISLAGIKPNFSNWGDTLSDASDFLVEKLSFLRYLFNVWIIVPLLLLAAAGFGVKYFALDWYHQQIAYETYSRVWKDLQRLRALELTDHQWDRFKVDTRSKIAEINASLEKRATIEDQYSMELLRAGRDYLPKMLDDARVEPSLSEQKFAFHMDKAARYGASQDLKAVSMNIVGTLFVIFDIVLVGLGLFLLFKKIRS